MKIHHPLTHHDRELPEGELPSDLRADDGTVIYSLTAHALQAMERHKWIESQKVGRDLGRAAYHHWLEQCWIGWVRSKLLEHLFGLRCWGAFGTGHFGLLKRSTVEHHVATSDLHRCSEILARGGENLDVISWALEQQRDLEGILWLLDRIDINAKRQRLLADHIRLFV